MDKIGTRDDVVARLRHEQQHEVDEVLHHVVALYAAMLDHPDRGGPVDAATARERLAVASLRLPALVERLEARLPDADDELTTAIAGLRRWAATHAGPATATAAEAFADPDEATIDRLVDHLAEEFDRIRDLL